MVVGWYHSHPGFGCWLSGVDINTQQSFEALSERAVAVVVDPIQSVKGKVKMDARYSGTCVLEITCRSVKWFHVRLSPPRLLLMPSDWSMPTWWCWVMNQDKPHLTWGISTSPQSRFVAPLKGPKCVQLLLKHRNIDCFLLFSGSDSWTQQTLLLHHHQLPEKRAGAKGLNITDYRRLVYIVFINRT